MKFFLNINFLFCLMCQVYAQQDTTIVRGGKSYRACICRNIKKLNCPDTIAAICFPSAGLKDFPKEILKYKKLKAIDFRSYSYEQVWDKLSNKQKAKYQKAFEVRHEKPIFIYKLNRIKKLPKEILQLKQLEFLDLSSTIISEKEFSKALKLLPDIVH